MNVVPLEVEPEALTRPRVLIVDDDERNLLALKTVIDDVAEVVTALSGEEALRHLLKYDFAAILLDVFMPIMDGYETARIIRQREQTKRIPIIFLSAINKEDVHLRRGYEMGAVDYVFKPVEPMILRSKVAVFVDLHEKTREIQQKAAREKMLREDNLRVHREVLMAEQALRRAEQRQALILQSLPIILYLEPVDAKPRAPYYVSGDLKALTGYDFEDVKANPGIWSERLHPADREMVLEARAQLPDVDKLAVEYRWMAHDGKYRNYLEQAVVLRDDNGNPTEIAGTLFDVTGQRKLEGQLAHAQKMDAVGKLTGGIAHDFNNLLAAVVSGLHLIERSFPLDNKQQDLIDLIRRSADQGTDLVKRLLAFARKQDLQASAVPIERLVKSLSGLLEHTLGGLVEVQYEVSDDISPALADENQLELALVNLILNARDAMPDGGKITVIAENRESYQRDDLADGPYVVISVVDCGIGISADDLALIFDPFFTTKDVGKGTGLGLSMVYGFAEQSGGQVLARSQLGKGTTFELWLPKADMLVQRADPPPPAHVSQSKSVRVLLVDDHEAVRATTHAMLDELGHTTSVASAASDALLVIDDQADAIDLIVTDYAMPHMSGIELIHRARAIRPGLPAVIVTGYADEALLGRRPDDVAVLSKPFSVVELQNAIEQAAVMDSQVADA